MAVRLKRYRHWWSCPPRRRCRQAVEGCTSTSGTTRSWRCAIRRASSLLASIRGPRAATWWPRRADTRAATGITGRTVALVTRKRLTSCWNCSLVSPFVISSHRPLQRLFQRFAMPRCQRRRRAVPLCRRGDRKSTRLNSSHVEISYAVFCLKKKKKTYIVLLFYKKKKIKKKEQ